MTGIPLSAAVYIYFTKQDHDGNAFSLDRFVAPLARTCPRPRTLAASHVCAHSLLPFGFAMVEGAGFRGHLSSHLAPGTTIRVP